MINLYKQITIIKIHTENPLAIKQRELKVNAIYIYANIGGGIIVIKWN